MPKKQQGTERNDEPVVQCSFAMCPTPAIMHARTRTGWANVCGPHDIELKTREANDWMRAQGIDRQPGETMRDWMTRSLAHVIVNKRPRTRSGASHASVPAMTVVADLLPSIAPPEPEHIGEFADWEEAPAPESALEIE